MGNDTQNNEEQLEMLLMTLEEVQHGICLFQSENQAKRVSLIQERFGKKNVITHNIADDDEDMGMVSSQDFRRWASQSDAKVVIIYNIQLLGIRFGDETVVEKLNFMRDQILAIGKLFVFGVSHYFHLLLSRNARDLYSCILYQFTFQDADGISIGMSNFNMGAMSGDDALAIERYREMKERIQSHDRKRDIAMYLSCMESWNRVREALSYEEGAFIRPLAEEVEEQYKDKDLEVEDVENMWILAGTWLGLEELERSLPLYEKVLCFVREQLGEEHLLYANALVEYTNYFEAVQDHMAGEKFYEQAIQIYREKKMEYSEKGRAVLIQRAAAYQEQSKFAEALEIYEDLLTYQRGKYGEKYYGNVELYNDIGAIYEAQGDLSKALSQYKKAMEILEITGKQGELSACIYQNICVAYLYSGNGKEAWKYIKKAKRMIEEIYGTNSIRLIRIYNSMFGVWNVRDRPDKAFEYLQKALALIKETRMDNTEVASYVYHNMGTFLCNGGQLNDAADFFRYAIKIREKIFGEKNEMTASSYEELAYILHKVSNEKESKFYIDKARNIYIALYGYQNDHVKRIDDYLKSLQAH
ncbi:MAG: tetratricopeptide repeat protein [Lachnospiraceae bacterium]|nr:tetratricopeptide repeat protein [Lachnospiraceae bacterium]